MYPQAIQGVDECVTSSETSLHHFAGLFWCESTTGDGLSMRGRVFMDYIYIYSFSRRFYPKPLSIEENNKRYIIKMQTDIGSACNTYFLGIVQSNF